MGDKWETSVNSCGPRHPEWKTSVEDKCKFMRPKEPRVGDKGKTSVDSCGPRNPEWETSVGDKCGRQVEDKCKFMRPKAPRVHNFPRGARQKSPGRSKYILVLIGVALVGMV